MTYAILACIIGALAVLIVHLTRELAYWKNMAMAEGRKRLQKDVKTENAHNAEIRRLNDGLRKSNEKIAELERNNKILRRMNEQLRRGNQEGGTKCP